MHREGPSRPGAAFLQAIPDDPRRADPLPALTVLVPGRGGTRDLGFVIADVLFRTRLDSEHRRPEVDALVTLTAEMPEVAHLRSGTVEG
ncbi:hypothetical protein ABZ746_25120 [Streptomyces sp. NPDC020096]